MQTNLNSRQIKAIETKKKIYDTAIELMETIGFENITINKICKGANVAVGTFYYYYKSLDFIIVESYKELDYYFEKLEKEGYFEGNYKEKIFKIVSEQISYPIRKGIKITTQFYKSQLTSENEYFTSSERKSPMLLRIAIEEGQDLGKITKDISSSTIRNDISNIIRGTIYSWCLRNGDFDPIKEGLGTLERYFKGIEI
ncbi:TetR/AcrR family transcriptional regulator [Clostridium chrysemydis]|uniref:TetR/AcrR family transcriptional regulator n=1 Tax=Clostridium chrysemydis TaxID=2665504 RepID=UPI001883BC3A|nr:TetR/AcrR family transcriptional regulator [Clostridium chrysemydis]